MIVNITNKLRLKRIDDRNVTVEKLSAKGEWVLYNGSGRGPYLDSMKTACLWVFNHGLPIGSAETDLRGFTEYMSKAEKRIIAAVKEAGL